MKKPLALRIEADLLTTARACARRDNRTLTNFIETALRDRIALMASVEPIGDDRTDAQGAKDMFRDA